MRSMYGSRANGQMSSVINKASAGLNAYTPSTEINDNHLSDALDAFIYRDEAIELYADASIPTSKFAGNADADGIIMSIMAIPITTTSSYAALTISGTDWKVKRVYDATNTITEYVLDAGTYGLPTTTPKNYKYDCCHFATETINYIMFTSSYVKKLIAFNYTSGAVTAVTLPFYPKRMISHANRIFIADTKNKIWWCRAGDYLTWYGTEYVDDNIVASTTMKNGTFTIKAQPDAARPITATITKVSTIDTYGTAVIVGTSNGKDAQTETIALIDGRVQTNKSFKTIKSITTSGWTAVAGADSISFGVAPLSQGYVQNDAGFWTIEKESSLSNLCLLNGNIYIFGQDNIYVLTGYSADTFSLNLVVSDIGVKEESAYYGERVVVVNNVAYFIQNGLVYEFDGSSYPRLISRPEYVNGAISNSMYGGIPQVNNSYVIAADNNSVYIYRGDYANHTTSGYYKFFVKNRSWWKMSALNNTDSVYASNFKFFFIPTVGVDSMRCFVSEDTAAGNFYMYEILGCNGSINPYITTKAYNTNPSEVGTLTELILGVSGTAGEFISIIFSYSLSSVSTSFTQFKKIVNHQFDGDLQILSIPVPTSIIANAHHYRLKIEIEPSGTTTTPRLRIFNIERRFRIRGRSR